jgi:hypothetical protein
LNSHYTPFPQEGKGLLFDPENNNFLVNLTIIYCKNFVDVTVYPQYNNHNFKKELKIREIPRGQGEN